MERRSKLPDGLQDANHANKGRLSSPTLYPFVSRREGLDKVYAKNQGSLRGRPLIKRDTRGSQLIFN